MKCPYCSNEMERGRIMASATGSIPVSFLEWYAEEDFEKKGFFAAIKRKSISIQDTKDGYYHDSYFCGQCKKVFGEFPTK